MEGDVRCGKGEPIKLESCAPWGRADAGTGPCSEVASFFVRVSTSGVWFARWCSKLNGFLCLEVLRIGLDGSGSAGDQIRDGTLACSERPRPISRCKYCTKGYSAILRLIT